MPPPPPPPSTAQPNPAEHSTAQPRAVTARSRPAERRGPAPLSRLPSPPPRPEAPQPPGREPDPPERRPPATRPHRSPCPARRPPAATGARRPRPEPGSPKRPASGAAPSRGPRAQRGPSPARQRHGEPGRLRLRLSLPPRRPLTAARCPASPSRPSLPSPPSPPAGSLSPLSRRSRARPPPPLLHARELRTAAAGGARPGLTQVRRPRPLPAGPRAGRPLAGAGNGLSPQRPRPAICEPPGVCRSQNTRNSTLSLFSMQTIRLSGCSLHLRAG